jgi:hypothetical protein
LFLSCILFDENVKWFKEFQNVVLFF